MRAWLARRVEQWRRSSALVGLLIHGSTLSLVAYGALGGRSLALWLVPVIFLGVLAGAFTASWAYYVLLDMREAEQRARFDLDVRDQHMLSPKEAKLIGLFAAAVRGDTAAAAHLKEIANRECL